MMTISSIYVHLQRPDNGEWVLVGRYSLHRDDSTQPVGSFMYAPSYLDAKHPWVIDPVNLPRLDSVVYPAPRYEGLNDVLRDIVPDAWGKLLIQREYRLRADAHEFDYLIHTSNTDRWGALAVSQTKRPNPSNIASPRLHQLEDLLQELQLMASQLPAKHLALRNRLIKAPSLGGARPKATVQDGSSYWIAKPTVATDVNNTALLEYAAMRWGARAGLNFAQCKLYQDAARTTVLIKRFDRDGMQRRMVLSGALLLEAEYPIGRVNGQQNQARWSYPLLAQSLRRIGVPLEDLNQLYGRMIFNMLCGNDDDHPRNHAVIWTQSEKRWRLSPAFDVVPNIDFSPSQLAMQISSGNWRVSRENLLADWRFFGFNSHEAAMAYIENITNQIVIESKGLEADGLSIEQATQLRAHMSLMLSKILPA